MDFIYNNLIDSDIDELEEAGLDVDELAKMEWSDRYDVISAAGLDPMDYDYGFPDDYEKIQEPEEHAAPVKEVKSMHIFGTGRSAAQKKPLMGKLKNPPKNNPVKLSRKERKAIEKAVRRAQSEIETDILMMMEVFSDDW